MNQPDPAEKTLEAPNFADVLRESLVSGVLAVTGSGRISALSPAAETLTHLKADTLLGQSSELLPAPLREFVAESLRSRAPLVDRQIVLRDADAAEFTLAVSSTPLFGDNGESNGVVLILTQLAATEKLGSNMQRLDRLASIGTLSASLAHEIKNALVAINTFVEDLLERNKDTELAGLVSREFRRIDAIVSQMLKFAGPAKPTFSRVSVHRIMDQSLHLIQPQLESKRIRLHRSFAARPDIVEGDDYQLEQAFLNILLNALAAMGTTGELSVTTKRITEPSADAGPAQAAVQIAIADTGTGIPPENLGRLFEPFFSTKAHGTGLGLAITRRIILEHRGKVGVESEVGKGTTFRFSLPLADQAG